MLARSVVAVCTYSICTSVQAADLLTSAETLRGFSRVAVTIEFDSKMEAEALGLRTDSISRFVVGRLVAAEVPAIEFSPDNMEAHKTLFLEYIVQTLDVGVCTIFAVQCNAFQFIVLDNGRVAMVSTWRGSHLGSLGSSRNVTMVKTAVEEQTDIFIRDWTKGNAPAPDPFVKPSSTRQPDA